MKKKKIIYISLISVVLIISLVASLIGYKNYKEEQKRQKAELKEQQLIKKTKEKYAFYLENEIIDNPQDNTSKLLNQVLVEEKKNEEINNDEIKNFINFENLETAISNLNEEITKYDITLLDNFTKKQIVNSFNKNIDKKTILNMYKQNKFIKNLKEEKEKRKTYLDKLITLKECEKKQTSWEENLKFYTLVQEYYNFLSNDLYNFRQNFILC